MEVVAHFGAGFEVFVLLVLDFVDEVELVEGLSLLVALGHVEREDGEELARVDEGREVVGEQFFLLGEGFAHEVHAAGQVFGPVEDRVLGPVELPGFRHLVVGQSEFDVLDVVDDVAVETSQQFAEVGLDLRQVGVVLGTLLDQVFQ